MQKKRMTGHGKLRCVTKYLRQYLDNKCDASEVVKHLFIDEVLHKLAYDVIKEAQGRWINTPLEVRSDEYNVTPYAEELCAIREKYSDLQLLLMYLRRTNVARIKEWFVLKDEFRHVPIEINRIPEWGFEFIYTGVRVTFNERTRELDYEKINGVD